MTPSQRAAEVVLATSDHASPANGATGEYLQRVAAINAAGRADLVEDIAAGLVTIPEAELCAVNAGDLFGVVPNSDVNDPECYTVRRGADCHGNFRLRAVAESHARDLNRAKLAGWPDRDCDATCDAGPMDATR